MAELGDVFTFRSENRLFRFYIVPLRFLIIVYVVAYQRVGTIFTLNFKRA